MRREATLVTVLRHGEVAGPAHVFRGRNDEPLTARGIEQMRSAVAVMQPSHFDAVATSPLRRCRSFADAFAAERGLVLQVLPDMCELDFGEWEGMTSVQAAERDAEAYERFHLRADSASAPGGETLGAFRKRVLAAWQAWLADADGGHRLLVTHAGPMRMLLQHLLDLPARSLYRVALPEAAHFQVSLLAGEAPVLMKLNGPDVI